MADINSMFGVTGGEIIGNIFGGVIYIIGFLIIAGLILGIFLYVRHNRKFDITVKIKSERAEDKDKIIFDKAAVLIDKSTGVKYFKLLNQRVELPIPPFNILQNSSKGDYLEIWRKSENEYIYLTPAKIDKFDYVKSDGKIYPMADVIQKQVEGDVAFWNVKRKQQNKSLFDTESIWLKLLPYIPQIIGGVLIIFVLYVLFDSLPEVLSALTELTKQLTSLKTAELKMLLPLVS